MINFRPIKSTDTEILTDWIERDLDHAGRMSAEWWSEGSVLSCSVDDIKGPVLFLRLDGERAHVRMHIQFAPEDVVSKIRTAKAILEGIPVLAELMDEHEATKIVFESTNDQLVKFMNRMGFKYWKDDDYALVLRET